MFRHAFYSHTLPYVKEFFLCGDVRCLLALNTYWWHEIKQQSVKDEISTIVQKMTGLVETLSAKVQHMQNNQKEKPD